MGHCGSRDQPAKQSAFQSNNNSSMPPVAVPSAAVAAAALASGGVESLGWLNDLVAQLWPFINVAGAAMVKETVEPTFKDLPGPLSSLHFEKIDLGPVPITFDNIDVHTKDKDSIKLDLDIIWDGDCDIQLQANIIGKFGVKSVKMKGRFSVVMSPLIERLPIVSAVQIAFINSPEIEIDFTGAAQVADLGIVERTIMQTIDGVLNSLLVLPNRMLIKLDPENNYLDTYQEPLGLVRVTVLNGKGFLVQGKYFNKDVPDVYCNIKFGPNPILKTSTKNNNTAPEWNESFDFLLSDHDQIITIGAFDDDDISGDDDLGLGKITVDKVLEAGGSTSVALEKKGKEVGASVSVKCDIFKFTPELTSFESPVFQGKNLMCGLLTILVVRATDIPGPKEKAKTLVKVTYGSSEFLTGAVTDAPGVDALNPVYDAAFLVPLTQEMAASKANVVLTLVNGETILGTTDVAHSALLVAPDKEITGRHQVGEGASIEFRASLRGVSQST